MLSIGALADGGMLHSSAMLRVALGAPLCIVVCISAVLPPSAQAEQTRALWVTRTTLDLAGVDQADGARPPKPAASTRCSCRCAAAATPITPARSSRARRAGVASRRSIRWRP